MCFIQAQYRIKGGTQDLSLENTRLFVEGNLIYFIQKCGHMAEQP